MARFTAAGQLVFLTLLSVVLVAFVVAIFVAKRWNFWSAAPRSQIKRFLSDVVQTARAPSKVSVVSWNVFLLSVACHDFTSRDFKNQRAQHVVGSVKAYDVVCLQEAFSTLNHRVHGIVKQAERFGYKYYVGTRSPGVFSMALVDDGLLTFSKYPIVTTEALTFSRSLFPDRWASKGAHYARIRLPHKDMHVFNCHLQSDCGTRPHDTSCTQMIRDAQIKQLRCFVRKHTAGASAQDLVVVCGDFNVDRGEHCEAFRQMRSELALHDALETFKAASRTTCHTYVDTRNNRFLDFGIREPRAAVQHQIRTIPRSYDYVLLSSHCAATVVPQVIHLNAQPMPLSDHAAVGATFEA